MTPEKLDELERLIKAGTPGPWQLMAGDPLAIDAHQAVYVAKMTGATPVTRLANNAALIVAAINALPELLALREEVGRLREALDSIRIYANDTLSGRVDGPDDREWQRGSVIEIRNRARAALGDKP